MLEFWSHLVCLGTDLTHVLTSVRLQAESQASLAPPPLDLSCKAVAQERLKGLEEEDGLSSGPPGVFVGQ